MSLPSWAMRLLINLAVPFALRQLAKWREQIDFSKVKADFAARIAALIPGEFLDAEAVKLSDALIDKVASVLASSEALEVILKLVVAGDFPGALEKLKDLLLAQFVPGADLAALSADEKDAKLVEALSA